MLLLVTNWVLEGGLKEKIKAFYTNKPALLISSLILLHLLGLIYTSDFSYALKDIKIKLPLLALPLIMPSFPKINTLWQGRIILSFFGSLALKSLFFYLTYFGWIHTELIITSGKDALLGISHIRFGIMLSLAIFYAAYLFIKKPDSLKPLYLGSLILNFATLYLLESFTGFAILFLGSIALLFIYSIRFKEFNKKLSCWLGIVALVGAVVVLAFDSISSYYIPKEDKNNVAKFTVHGEKYDHNFQSDQLENGYYVYMNYAPKEVKNTWNSRSLTGFLENDVNGNQIKWTLIRYMTSKGLKKDREGVLALSEQDIKNIQNGICNIDHAQGGMRKRIDETIFELNQYLQTGDPNGKSIAQRLEYWKTGIHIISKNALIGVGTGDPQRAYDKAYQETNTLLEEKMQLRAHNQFLTIFICFGIIGLVWFLGAIIYPLILRPEKLDFFFISFFVVVMLSFLWEDTLETQVGVSFFAFFYSLWMIADRSSYEGTIALSNVESESILDESALKP